MKEYMITMYVPEEDKPAEDTGDWLIAPTFFALGALTMLLLLLP